MRIMDLRQLEYFLRVAQRRNISIAAAELNITQPSLTKSIKLLEKNLGVRLFDRLARGVELTDYGRTLMRHAEAVHVQVGDAAGEIAALRSGTFGAVTIGAGPAWLRRHLPLAIAQAVARYPGIRVRVAGGFDDELYRSLRGGAHDFVVAELPRPEDRRGLDVRALTSDELGVCCRAGHPLSVKRRVAPESLLAYPWVRLPRTTRSQQRLEALFGACDLEAPQNVVETTSHAFLLSFLRQSDSLTFTTARTVATEEGAGLVMLSVPRLTTRREAGIVRRRGGCLSPAAQQVMERLVAVCARDPQN